MRSARKRTFGQKRTHLFSSILSGKPLALLSLFFLLLSLPLAILLTQKKETGKEKASATSTDTSLVANLIANCSTTNLVWVSPNGSDSNPGTQAAPWKTFYYASQHTKAGQTAIFMDGTYNETQETSIFTTGTATSPVCFESQNPWGATLSYSLGTGVQTSIMLYGPYQYFLNFQLYITNADPTIYIYGMQTWYGCNHCIIAGNKISLNTSIPKRNGIKPNGDFTIIDSNYIESPDGVDSVDSEGIIVSNNDFHLTNATTTGHAAIVLKGGNRNDQVYNNYIHTNQSGMDSGIVLGGASCASCSYVTSGTGFENYNSVAWNNVIAPDAPGASFDTGLMLDSCSNCTMSNNVVIGATKAFDSVLEISSEQKTYNPTFINNIAVNETYGFPNTNGYSGTLTLDYNLFYNVTNPYPQAHEITGKDPLFVNTYSDWHLQSTSPAIGAAETAGPFASYSDSSTDTCLADASIYGQDRYPCTGPTPAISILYDNSCSLQNGTWTCTGLGYQRITPWDMGAYDHRDGTVTTLAPTATSAPSPTSTITPTPTLAPISTNTPAPTKKKCKPNANPNSAVGC